MTDPLEDVVKSTKLLVLACDEDGLLSIEENGFPAWQVSGIAHWLGMWAEAEMEEEAEEED